MIVWWQDPAEPAKLLAEGKVSLASGFNGRFFVAAHPLPVSSASIQKVAPSPIIIVWDGQLVGHSVWVIPASSNNVPLAKDFIAFATAPDQMARLAEHIPYAPARQSALVRVGSHAKLSIPMRDHLPNSPKRKDRTIRIDSQWYAHTDELRRRLFNEWITKGESP